MIYLTTGANGAGKTLNTLKLVREKQVKEGRTVYYNGFAMKPDKAAEFGWLPFDPKAWQALPDGAILICDEAQNEFPVRGSSAPVPEYVRALSEHRRRGFDFFMVTQHPQNLDMFVRRLIGSPGWHRHIKRAFGANMVSVLEWSAVNSTCEKEGSGKSARVSMVGYPKEVYEWYDSASLHTAKKSIPRQVGFRSLTESIETETPQGRMFLQLLGVFAEFERELIRERCLAGQVAARARGQTWGKKPLFNLVEAKKIASMWRWGIEQRTLSVMFECSLSTLRDTIHRAENRGRWKRPASEK